MIERNFIFCNRNAYDIERTINHIHDIFHDHDEEFFPHYRLEAIVSVLMDFKFLVSFDMDTMLPNPYNGCETCIDIWLSQFGVVDHPITYADEWTVATWTTNGSLSEMEGEECITAEEEDELVTAVAILSEMNAETQNLDVLGIFGHDQDEIMDQFDSFLDGNVEEDTEKDL